jgi:hypothetical protein
MTAVRRTALDDIAAALSEHIDVLPIPRKVPAREQPLAMFCVPVTDYESAQDALACIGKAIEAVNLFGVYVTPVNISADAEFRHVRGRFGEVVTVVAQYDIVFDTTAYDLRVVIA